jgi:hypothetical protein
LPATFLGIFIMRLSEAIAALEEGKRIRTAKGSVFWVGFSSKGVPTLYGEPAGYGKTVKHVVFSSEDFRDDRGWQIDEPTGDTPCA